MTDNERSGLPSATSIMREAVQLARRIDASSLDFERARTLVLIARELRSGSRSAEPFDEWVGIRWSEVAPERVAEVRLALENLRLAGGPPVGKPHHCATCDGWFATPYALRAHSHRSAPAEPDEHRELYGWRLDGSDGLPTPEQASRADAFRAFVDARVDLPNSDPEMAWQYRAAGKLIWAYRRASGSDHHDVHVHGLRCYADLDVETGRCRNCGEELVETSVQPGLGGAETQLVHKLTRQALCPEPAPTETIPRVEG